MRTYLRAPLKPLNTIMLWCLTDFRSALSWEFIMSRDASFLDSCSLIVVVFQDVSYVSEHWFFGVFFCLRDVHTLVPHYAERHDSIVSMILYNSHMVISSIHQPCVNICTIILFTMQYIYLPPLRNCKSSALVIFHKLTSLNKLAGVLNASLSVVLLT